MRLALAVAAVALALMLTSSWNDSPSFDEPEHATAGYCYVRTGQFWMNPFHPPLAKALSGLALAAVPNQPPWEAWQSHKKMQAIDDFWCRLGNDPQQLIRAARLPLIVACSLFLLLFHRLACRQFGRPAAHLGLVLLAFSPTWLAHARLVNTDALAAAAAFTCLSLLALHLERGDRRSLVGLGLATGVAHLIKFSLAILLPFYLLAYLLWRRNPVREGAVIAGLTVLVVAGVYTAVPVPPDYQLWYNQIIFKREDALVRFLRAHPSPPLWYLTGLHAQTRHLVEGHDRPSYLRRRYYQGGRWDFFPTLMLTKEPTAWILLGLVALAGAWRRPSRAAALHLGFVTIYLAVALSGNLNMGIRHALPVFPSLFAVMGWGLAAAQERWRAARGLVALGLAWGLLSGLAAWPGYLAYFNELAGGKRLGPMVALDSNFDWGVDLYRLKLWADRQPGQQLATLTFGRLPVSVYLGPRARPFTNPYELKAGDRLAISANYWVQLQLHKAGRAAPPLELSEDVARWLASMEVIETVGDTQLIVRVR